MSRYVYRERPSVADMSLQRPKWVLGPESTSKIVLDNLVLICLAAITLLTPLEIAFELQVWVGVEVICNFVFVLDILVSFNCAYPSHGQIIYDRKRIVIRYLKTWFVIDILSTFPWYYILKELTFHSKEYNLIKNAKISKLSRSVRAVRAVRLVRLMRMAKLNPLMSLKTRPCIVLTKQFSILAVLCHIVGCLWFTIGVVEYPDSWINTHALSRHVEESILMRNHSTNTTFHKHEQLDIWSCYITSAYWAFTTLSTVGFGDIVGTTPSEYIFSMFVMGIGVMWAGITVASITQSITNKRNIERRLDIQRAHVTFLLRTIRLNDVLYSQIYNYYWYNPVELRTNFLESMPLRIKSNITLIMREKMLPQHAVLSSFKDQSKFADQAKSISFEMYAPGTYLCLENTPVNKIYFILRGNVRATHAGVFFAEYNQGTCYGCAEHHYSSKYTLTLHVQTYTIVATIASDMFKDYTTLITKCVYDLEGIRYFSDNVEHL